MRYQLKSNREFRYIRYKYITYIRYKFISGRGHLSLLYAKVCYFLEQLQRFYQQQSYVQRRAPKVEISIGIVVVFVLLSLSVKVKAKIKIKTKTKTKVHAHIETSFIFRKSRRYD